MPNNRADRRKFTRTFKAMAAENGWGDWREEDINSQRFKDCLAKASGRAHGNRSNCKAFWFNNIYSVQFYEHYTSWGEVTQILVRRHDGTAKVPWRHLQRIKNELVGPERVGVEVFPANSNLVDQANCFHIWVLPEGFELPFGLHSKGWSR